MPQITTTTLITSLLVASASFFKGTDAFATTITTDWTTRSTRTTLGYTLTDLVFDTSVITPVPQTDTVTCPQGYGTISRNLCIIPASGYSSAKPTLIEPPITITTTYPGEFGRPTAVNGSITTAPIVVTVTDSSIYCPPPYAYWAGGCYMSTALPSLNAAQSTGALYILLPKNASSTASSRVATAMATTTTSMMTMSMASTSTRAPAASTVAPNPGNAAGHVAAGNGVVLAVGLMAVAAGVVLVL